jgi:hypothetical protein
MVAEAKVDVHHFAPCCLLVLFDAEAERWGIEVRGLPLEDLSALIERSTRQIPTSEHRSLHQEEGDFVQCVDAEA